MKHWKRASSLQAGRTGTRHSSRHTDGRRLEHWANFAEKLRALVYRAYPTIEEKEREQLALNHYLGEFENPQVAFSTKQQRPKMVEKAVTAILEVDTYLGLKATGSAGIAAITPEDCGKEMPVAAVADHGRTDSMTEMMKQLLT